MKYEDKPTECGWYWVKSWVSSKPARIIKVWKYTSDKDRRLFTNEDGGALIEDEMYDNHRWYGPLKEPSSI